MCARLRVVVGRSDRRSIRVRNGAKGSRRVRTRRQTGAPFPIVLFEDCRFERLFRRGSLISMAMGGAIGVDLGGTNLRVAIVDEQGRMLEKLVTPTVELRTSERVI